MIISKAVQKLQKELGIPITESQLRFYEQQGFIKLNRLDNNYRDISDRDLATLTKICAISREKIDLALVPEILKGNKQIIEEVKEEIKQTIKIGNLLLEIL